MIGIIIATHGEMSNGIVSAADLIIGSTGNIKTLNFNIKRNKYYLDFPIRE